MNVLQICAYFPPFSRGGDAYAAYNYLLSMNDKQVINDVILWPIVPKFIKKSNLNLKLKNKIYRVKLSRYYYILSRLFNYNIFIENYLINFLKNNPNKYDIIQFHGFHVYGLHIFKKLKKLKYKVFVTLHDYSLLCPKATLIKYNNEDCEGRKSFRECNNCLLKSKLPPHGLTSEKYLEFVDYFICPSKYIQEIHQKAFPRFKNRFIHIQNGIKKENYQKYPLNQLHNNFLTANYDLSVLFVGRLETVKGIFYLLKAFKNLPSSIILIIIGQGTLTKLIENYISRFNLHKSIYLLGTMSNEQVMKFYASVDLVILPSIWKENNSMVLIESISSGIPSITTDIGGNKEIIENNKNGFIINPKNSNEIRNLLIRILENKNDLEKMKKKCFEKFENEFSLKVLGTNLKKLYNDSLTGK